jgi:hypothetical protein
MRDAIGSGKAEVIKGNVPAGEPARGIEVGHGDAELVTVSFSAAVNDSCATANVNASYEWKVTWDVFFNGKTKHESKPVKGARTFRCSKAGAAWRCG